LSLSFKGFQEALEGLGVHFVILSTSGEGDGTHFSQLPNVEDSTSGFRKNVNLDPVLQKKKFFWLLQKEANFK
jgi:hypothetical protein